MPIPPRLDPRDVHGVTTPAPMYAAPDASSPPQVGVGAPMDQHERAHIRAAAFRAQKLYPGPVGAFLHRELMAWDEFGRRLSKGGLVMQVVHHIMTAPLPERGTA